MPIYEFYCGDCNTLFNFFSARVDTAARPVCPRCEKRRLERRPARFATLRQHADAATSDPFAAVDENNLERMMGSMMQDLESLDDSEDPRRLAKIFRRFGDVAGVEPGPRMEEILARLEAGESPDELDSELGGDLDESADDAAMNDLFRLKRQLAARAAAQPKMDETLYFL